MAPLASPLECLLQVRMDMENGASVRKAIHQYLDTHNNEFRNDLCEWILELDGGVDPFRRRATLSIHRPHRRALLELLRQGLHGEPILKALGDLEMEMIDVCQDQVEVHLRRLPILALVPLMLFQVPAFLLLLFGPILQDLLGSFV